MLVERLLEGEVLDGVPLSGAEAGALQASGLVTVSPAGGGWRVAASDVVGASPLVAVSPVVGAAQALTLLARSAGLGTLTFSGPELTSALTSAFVSSAERALRFGPARGYRSRELDSPVLRGRLRLREQELRRFGRPVPVAVTADEPTVDVAENRRLRFAVRRFAALPRLPAALAVRLARLESRLVAVPAEPSSGGLAGLLGEDGFRFSMSGVFGRLVTRLLTEAAGTAGPGFGVLERPPLGLDTRGRLTLRPDLVVTAGGRAVAVAMVGYSPDFPSPDGQPYELLACCARLGLDTGHLIRASDRPRPETYDVVGSGVRLVVHGVDLRQPLSEVESGLRRVFAKLVRRQPISATA